MLSENESGDIIRIIFLGTSAGVPTKDRNVTSVLVLRRGEYIFFDFGEGTQRQVFTLGLGFRKRIKIFVSHMHGDHILGLPGLLQTLSLFKRTAPLEIYGPPQLKQFIELTTEMMNVELSFPIHFHTVYDGAEFHFRDYYVKAVRNMHWGISFSYMLKEYDRPGTFNVELASSLGIPKEYWGPLSRGEDITYNGKTYRSSDFFIPPPIKGRKIVFSGDTMPFDGMIELARDADVLIHEATYTTGYYERSLETQHTTARDAAEIARKSNVKILVLTHFSARYGDVEELIEEAREVFPSTFIANDLDYIDIPYIKPKRK